MMVSLEIMKMIIIAHFTHVFLVNRFKGLYLLEWLLNASCATCKLFLGLEK